MGLISQLNPNFQILNEMKPHIKRLYDKNRVNIAEKTIDAVKYNFNLLTALPSKVDNLVNNLEQGHFKMKVDYNEISEKIDEVKGFIIKLISFMISLISAISSYVFYTYNQINISFMFSIIGSISFLWFLIYKKRSTKDRIRKLF